MIEIEKPQIERLKSSDKYGEFEISPLERGYGTTLGNSLRRILLSSLPGAAITSVKIEGVRHEFSSIEGVKEDVTEIILNLKEVVLRYKGEEKQTMNLSVEGKGEVTAGDFRTSGEVEVINNDHHIATLAEGGRIMMEVTVESGRGYVVAEENKEHFDKIINSYNPCKTTYTLILNKLYKNYSLDEAIATKTEHDVIKSLFPTPQDYLVSIRESYHCLAKEFTKIAKKIKADDSLIYIHPEVEKLCKLSKSHYKTQWVFTSKFYKERASQIYE